MTGITRSRSGCADPRTPARSSWDEGRGGASPPRDTSPARCVGTGVRVRPRRHNRNAEERPRSGRYHQARPIDLGASSLWSGIVFDARQLTVRRALSRAHDGGGSSCIKSTSSKLRAKEQLRPRWTRSRLSGFGGLGTNDWAPICATHRDPIAQRRALPMTIIGLSRLRPRQFAPGPEATCRARAMEARLPRRAVAAIRTAPSASLAATPSTSFKSLASARRLGAIATVRAARSATNRTAR